MPDDNKDLVDELKNVPPGELVKHFIKVTKSALSCPFCGGTTFGMIVDDDHQHLIAFTPNVISEHVALEEVIYYKMSCNKCGIEYNINAKNMNDIIKAGRDNGE